MSQCKYCGEEVKDHCEHKKTAEGIRVIDREKLLKVLKGLKVCAGTDGSNCNDCPYYTEDYTDSCCKLFADATELYEDIEHKRMRIAPIIYYKRREFMGNSVIGWLACGCCGKDMDTSDHYCRHCGTEVDWDAEDLAWRRYETGGTCP